MKLGNLYLSAISSNNHGIELMERGEHEQASKSFNSALTYLRSSVEQQQLLNQRKIKQHQQPKAPVITCAKDLYLNHNSNNNSLLHTNNNGYGATSQTLSGIRQQVEDKDLRMRNLSYLPLSASFVLSPALTTTTTADDDDDTKVTTTTATNNGESVVPVVCFPIRMELQDHIDDVNQSGCCFDDILKLDVETVIILFNTSINYIYRVKEGSDNLNERLYMASLKILFLAHELIKDMLNNLPTDMKNIHILFGIHQVELLFLDTVDAVLQQINISGDNNNTVGSRSNNVINITKVNEMKERRKVVCEFFSQYKAMVKFVTTCPKFSKNPSTANAA